MITVTSKGLDIELVKILIIVTLIDVSCNNLSGPIPRIRRIQITIFSQLVA